MKIKFNVALGGAVLSYKDDDVTLQQAVELLQQDEVISITVTKQTPAQYLKTVRAISEAALGGGEDG